MVNKNTQGGGGGGGLFRFSAQWPVFEGQCFNLK